ncbi:hypothetical protein ACFL20_02955 [Spirochaetota bacterium]
MLNKKVQIIFGCLLIILGIVYLSCKDDRPRCTDVPCNKNGTCEADETLMCCPEDCFDPAKVTGCRAAYNESRMSCMDFIGDFDHPNYEKQSKMDIYNYMLRTCENLASGDYCQFADPDDCVFTLSQTRTCLQQACNDPSLHSVCIIPPVETAIVQSLKYGMITIPVWPNDPGWTDGACWEMTGYENPCVNGGSITCDLY